MIRYISAFALLVTLFINLQAQDTTSLHIYLQDTSATLDEQVCMSVRVNNFDSIEAFQLSLNFDPYLLDFDSIADMNTSIGLNEGFFGLQERNIGIVRLTFFDAFQSYSLPDSTVLFDICFTAYGMPGELCPVNLSDFPLPLEFISNEQVVDEFSRRDAEVTISGGNDLALITNACKTDVDSFTGSLSITAYGGNPPYFILWANTINSDFSGGFELDTFGSTRVLTDLAEGRYRVVVTDEDGLRLRDSLNIRKANDLIYSTEVINPLCDNTTDGAIIIDSLRGGITPPQFKWSDGQLFLQDRNNLAPGSYGLTITDPLGCRTLDTFELQANSIQVTSMAEDESCLNTGNGSFSLDIFGGDPIDSLGYLIEYANDTTFGTSLSDMNLSSGSYEIFIVDSLGCEKDAVIEIGTGLSFGAEVLDVINVGCNGDSTGSIFLAPKTLTGIEELPYIFQFSGTDDAIIDSSSILLDELKIGSYSITVTDQSGDGCQWDTTLTINQPPNLIVQTTSVVPASCDPDNDGEATIIVFGGIPDGEGDYLILWDDGQDSLTALNIDADTHIVRVIDLEGCIVDHEVIVPNTDPPRLIGESIRGLRCDSMPTGSILAIFSSPFGLANYQWSTGDSTSSIEDIQPGEYSVTVTDRNGCASEFVFEAASPAGPVISDLIVQNIQCFGDSNGRLDVEFDLGDEDLSGIAWNGIPGDDSLTNLSPGGYQVVIFDRNGCVDSAATTLVAPQPISVIFEVTDDVDSTGTGRIAPVVFGGWSPYTFSWLPAPLPSDSLITNLQAGLYTMLLTDNEGCTYSDTISVGLLSGTFTRSNDLSVRMYPNPVIDNLQIVVANENNQDIDEMRIYNANGRKVSQSSWSHDRLSTIDVSAYTPGLYMLLFFDENRQVGQQYFIKQ